MEVIETVEQLREAVNGEKHAFLGIEFTANQTEFTISRELAIKLLKQD